MTRDRHTARNRCVRSSTLYSVGMSNTCRVQRALNVLGRFLELKPSLTQVIPVHIGQE